MTEWKPGQRVVVNGKFDGETFVNEAGEIVEAPSYMDRHFLVRFDRSRHVFHNGKGSREEDENRHWYFTKGVAGYSFTQADHSTYLNGHADQISGPSVDTSGKSLPLGTSPSTKETTKAMYYLTAWKTGLDFTLTGGDNPFPSQREADNHANELAATHGDTTVVVLKVTSQHSSRVVVTTEHAA